MGKCKELYESDSSTRLHDLINCSLIAERLSARELIVQCGLKSQLAYIYMCATSITLRNAIKSPVTFLIRVITMSVRSVYVLLLQL